MKTVKEQYEEWLAKGGHCLGAVFTVPGAKNPFTKKGAA